MQLFNDIIKNEDWHFHYFPQFHEQYKNLEISLTGMIVIHDFHYNMNGFRDGMKEISEIYNLSQGIELSISHNFWKVKRNLQRILDDGYQVIFSIHSYKDYEDFFRILDENKLLFSLIHHLGHPFHKEKRELPLIVQDRLISFLNDNGVSVELNERYSRKYNSEFYIRLKQSCSTFLGTDSHNPKSICDYRKLTRFGVIKNT